MNKIATTVAVSTLAMAGLGLVYASNDRYEEGQYYKGKYCEHKYEGKRGEYYLQRMTKKLGLSDDQATQIRTIKEKYRPQKQQLRDEMLKNRASLREAMHADPLDEAKMNTLAESMGQLKTEKILLKSKMMSEMNQVLTPEQREMKKDMKHHRGYKHHRHGEHHERSEKYDD